MPLSFLPSGFQRACRVRELNIGRGSERGLRRYFSRPKNDLVTSVRLQSLTSITQSVHD